MKPGRWNKYMFPVQPHYIIHSKPTFWSKVEHLFGRLCQNHHLYMVADYMNTSKRSLLVREKSTRILGWQSKRNFQSNLAIFYQVNLYFGLKETYFVAGVARKTCTMYVFRLTLYHLNFTVSSLPRFVKPERGIIDGFLLQPHHFPLGQYQFWRKSD